MTGIGTKDTGSARRTPAPEALELWRSYAAAGDPRVRDQLVLRFAPMVQYIVSRKTSDVLRTTTGLPGRVACQTR